MSTPEGSPIPYLNEWSGLLTQLTSLDLIPSTKEIGKLQRLTFKCYTQLKKQLRGDKQKRILALAAVYPSLQAIEYICKMHEQTYGKKIRLYRRIQELMHGARTTGMME